MCGIRWHATCWKMTSFTSRGKERAHAAAHHIIRAPSFLQRTHSFFIWLDGHVWRTFSLRYLSIAHRWDGQQRVARMFPSDSDWSSFPPVGYFGGTSRSKSEWSRRARELVDFSSLTEEWCSYTICFVLCIPCCHILSYVYSVRASGATLSLSWWL